MLRPQVGPSFVERPRLTRQLTRWLSGPITLVCAPAGYGKTTLVSGWIERWSTGEPNGLPLPSAWLTLDSRDNDLTVFTRYVVAAIHSIFPDACREITGLLAAPGRPRPALLSATLSNEIAALPSPFLLVLDDYSTINDEGVHDCLNALFQHLPAPLHLVLSARGDPPLALARLRARGLLAEIRVGDLRFTEEEIVEYLEQNTSIHASQSLVAQLDETTEGWIAGLFLAVRSLSSPGLSRSGPIPRSGGAAYVADYLFNEVLSVQSQPVRTFLLKTAILERFSPALAAAVIGSDTQCDVRACMDFIQRADLFVTALDDRREWYRYHGLFQAMLQRRLEAEYGPDEVGLLHERASLWYSSQGRVDDALHHALAADNLELAAQIIEQGVHDALNREDPHALERQLRLLPEEFIVARPGLLLVRAWLLQFSWQMAAQARLVDQIEALLAASDQATLTWAGSRDLRPLHGQLALLAGQRAFLANQFADATVRYQEAQALLPRSWAYLRGGVILELAMTSWFAAGAPDIVPNLLNSFATLIDQTDLYALRHLLGVCFISVLAGQLEQTRQTASALLMYSQRSSSALMPNWARYFLGLYHLERNELAAASERFSEMVAHHHTTFNAVLHDGFSGMALTQQAQGDFAGAAQTIGTLSELDLDRMGREDVRTSSLRAGLLLRQGDVDGAGRWADAFTMPVPDAPLLWMEMPHLTKARILIRRNRKSDIPTALGLLDAVFALAERTHNTIYQIRILALRALALETAHQPQDALHVLQQAVDLAHPGGFIRVFVDLGPPMKGLLRRLAEQGYQPEAIRRLLDVFPQADSSLERPNASGIESTPGHSSQGLVEPLTQRELEILALLRGRLSGKEIARELVLSPATVKRHTANIYGKLGVNRRADAVVRAESLGLLRPG